VPPPASSRGITTTQHRRLAAIALLAVGAVHLEQYTVAHYSAVPTIGVLFLANFVAATAFGLALLAPLEAISPRLGRFIYPMAALGGLGVSAGALAALLISERTPLFGFMEHGYRFEIVIAIAVETIAIVALGTMPATSGKRR
jgi:hypothetical protein